ncbi:restriction endonuclease subunit S [Vibrio scophthalmi]|uniref:restriction endonuclease subunit S n=1 Tax=Vibrio scophthalmi TaxID=45658 RepID=UPI002FF1B181
MSKFISKGSAPKLRFSRHDGSAFPDWEYIPLRLVAKRVINKNKENKVSRVLTNSASDGVVEQRDYFNKDIAVKDNLDGYYIVDHGDYVYNPRISSLAPVGPISKNNVGLGVMSPLYTVFRFYDQSNDFYEQFFKFSSWHVYLQRIANMGARHDRINISSSEFMEMPVPKPDCLEQKKIAECLCSMDDLISANNKKLESLRAQKKGLMQKLFPAEGKNVPDLRFDGFEDEWEEIELRKLGDLISGLTYSPDDVRDSGLLVLRSSNVQNGKIEYKDNVFVDPNIKGAKIAKPDDILICVRNGSKALIGKSALIPQNVPFSTHGAFMTMFRSKHAKLVFQLFQTESYQRQVDADLGATINSINGKKFLKYKFRIPRSNDEKDMIVKCLSSLDNLINAQVDKCETLKQYKQGTMQQLFPEIMEPIA